MRPPRPSRLLPNRIRRSYAAKLFVAIAVVAIVIAAFGTHMYLHAGAVLERETERELVTSTQIQAEQIDEWLGRMEIQIRALSESAAFQSDDRSRIAIRLFDTVQRDEHIQAAYYVDTRTNAVIMSTGSARVLSSSGVLKRSGQNQLLSVAQTDRREVFVSRPFRPYEGSDPVLLLVSAVPNRTDRAVVAVVDLRRLSGSLLHPLDDGEFVVVNRSGRVVMAEREGLLLSRDGIDRSELAAESGFTTRDGVEDTGRTAVAHAHLDSRDWIVTARVPTERAYALRTDISRGILAILLLVFGGSLLIGVTVGRNTISTIRDLSGRAARLRTGRLDEPVETDREDEFGDLYRAFDAMRKSLRNEIEQAEEAREAAEAERRESEAFNAHLERTADYYGSVMAACAAGDLDRRIDPDDRSDAMADIADSFNTMMADVRAQNERMEAFVGILSHDLRNPLTVALGRARMLESRESTADVDALLRALTRMETIIEDALALASLRSVDDVRPLDLEVAAETAWGHVATRDATLDASAAEVRADPDLLAHVFENLFRNAVEHGSTSDPPAVGDAAERDTTEQGTADSRSAATDAVERGGEGVTVRVGPTGDGFHVSDDGPGIPPDRRDDVFETGYTTNRAGGGTGFGLAIVKQVADAHGWSVRVGGSASGGARFEFEVPPDRRASPDRRSPDRGRY